MIGNSKFRVREGVVLATKKNPTNSRACMESGDDPDINLEAASSPNLSLK